MWWWVLHIWFAELRFAILAYYYTEELVVHGLTQHMGFLILYLERNRYKIPILRLNETDGSYSKKLLLKWNEHLNKCGYCCEENIKWKLKMWKAYIQSQSQWVKTVALFPLYSNWSHEESTPESHPPWHPPWALRHRNWVEILLDEKQESSVVKS